MAGNTADVLLPLLSQIRSSFDTIKSILDNDEKHIEDGYRLLDLASSCGAPLGVIEQSTWAAGPPPPQSSGLLSPPNSVPYNKDTVAESRDEGNDTNGGLHAFSFAATVVDFTPSKRLAEDSYGTGEAPPEPFSCTGLLQSPQVPPKQNAESCCVGQTAEYRFSETTRRVSLVSPRRETFFPPHASQGADVRKNDDKPLPGAVSTDRNKNLSENFYPQAVPFFETSNAVPLVTGAHLKAAHIEKPVKRRCTNGYYASHQPQINKALIATATAGTPRRNASPANITHRYRDVQLPRTFWIHVWPCFGSYSSSTRSARVCVFPYYRYIEDVLEVAATTLDCRPCPQCLHEPTGRKVQCLSQLVPEQHYLLFPCGGFYRREAVPSALLQELVHAAKLALLDS